jgi:hypothetical protein
MPYICWVTIGITAVVREGINISTQVREEPEAVRGLFIPPSGEGYQYFVGNGKVVYVFMKSRGLYRCYIVEGETPRVFMRRDRHGRYFTLHCPNTATAERLIDQVYEQMV